MASRLPAFLRRRRVVVGLQLAAVAALLAFFGYVLRDVWADALPRLADADPVYLAAALGVLAAYYLLFAVGWWWLLAALRIRVGYGVALQAEMASMLAKYIPGGVWTPLARIVWLRKAGGVSDTSFVVSSILLEAGLSAVAGILVFTVGLAAVDAVDAPLVPLFAFAAVTAILLHPRVFTALARVIFRRFDAPVPARLPYRILVGLLGYYSCTWLVGGTALYLLLRSLDADPGIETIPYLGGAAAVGAIVAVLTRLRALRPRRARGVDVRPARGRRAGERGARGDRAQPPGDHARRGGAARRRAARRPPAALTSRGGR